MNITLPREQAPNRYLTPDLAFSFRYFALRKLHFLLRARAVDFDFMVAQGTIAQSDRELFCSAEDGESAWHALAAWYARHGDEVFPSRP